MLSRKSCFWRSDFDCVGSSLTPLITARLRYVCNFNHIQNIKLNQRGIFLESLRTRLNPVAYYLEVIYSELASEIEFVSRNLSEPRLPDPQVYPKLQSSHQTPLKAQLLLYIFSLQTPLQRKSINSAVFPNIVLASQIFYNFIISREMLRH